MATQSPLNLLPLDQDASAGDAFDALEFVVSPPESPGNSVATGVTENEDGTYTVSSTAPFGNLGYAGGNDPTISDYTVTLGITTVSGDPVYQFAINFYQDFSSSPFLSEDYKVDGWNSTSILLQNLNTDPDYTGNAYLILSSANIVTNGGTSGNLPSNLTFGFTGAAPFSLPVTTFTLNNPSGVTEAQSNVAYVSATKNSDGTYTVYNDGGGDDGAFSTNPNDVAQAGTGAITLYSDANDTEVQSGAYYSSTRALVFNLRAADGFNYVVGANNGTSYDGQIVGWNDDSILINIVSGIDPRTGAVAGATQNYYVISAENLANSGTNNGVPLTSGAVFDQDPNTLQEAAAALGLNLTVSCFTPGTRIRTTGGAIAVETLRVGDAVTTVDAAGKTGLDFVRWVGRRRLDIANHPDPEMVAPIRFRAGSLGQGLPQRDLLLSPDHCLALDGCLVRAFRLVNGASIVQETDWPSIEYLHVELSKHALLLAEGVPAESYLDEGHRGFFDAVPTMAVPGSLDDSAARPGACLPFAPDDAFVEVIWQRLARRAGARHPAATGRVDPGAELQVQADGLSLRPVLTDGARHIYALPPTTRELRLVSPVRRPSTRRPWVEDRRRLGVCVRAVMLDDGSDLALDGPALGDGWWPVEGGGRQRWTAGDAVVTLPPATRCVELRLAG